MLYQISFDYSLEMRIGCYQSRCLYKDVIHWMLRDANWVQNNTCRAVPKSVVDERLYIFPCNLSLFIVKLLA